MASEAVTSPGPAPTRPWLTRLGRSGMFLAIGALAGIISAFLPLMFVSFQTPGPDPGGVTFHNATLQVDQSWQGMLSLVGFLAALIGPVVLYPAQGSAKRALVWAWFGAGLLVVVLALWLLLAAVGMGTAALLGRGPMSVAPGVGAFLNLVAALLVAAGGFLKACEEKLI
jgi:hypothetical protein